MCSCRLYIPRPKVEAGADLKLGLQVESKPDPKVCVVSLEFFWRRAERPAYGPQRTQDGGR